MIRRRRRGFTFIELIASLAIILLMAGLLMPVFARARESARRTSCQSNLQQLGLSLHLYAQDNDGRFPPEDHNWAFMFPYTKNSQVFACPSEPTASKERFQSGRGVNVGQRWTALYSSYQYRSGLSNDDWGELEIARDWGLWHQGGANVLHLGSSVKWMDRKDLTPLTRSPRPEPAKGKETVVEAND
jgi:prepilin-type N-terminal cleavage/methylation domain-containing protein